MQVYFTVGQLPWLRSYKHCAPHTLQSQPRGLNFTKKTSKENLILDRYYLHRQVFILLTKPNLFWEQLEKVRWSLLTNSHCKNSGLEKCTLRINTDMPKASSPPWNCPYILGGNTKSANQSWVPTMTAFQVQTLSFSPA
jgi:hypothetical protein